LGGDSITFYTAGGAIGEMLSELLQEEGINIHPLPIRGITRVNLTVLEEASGQQYRFVMPGPELKEEEWQRCLDEIVDDKSEPAYIVASGSLPRRVPADFHRRLAHSVREAGNRLIVDTSGDALRAAAGEGVYLLKPNMRELAHLAGHEIENEDQQEKVAKALVERKQAEAVVVSLGPAGALAVSEDWTQRIPAPTVRIRSKIGAGDSMVAGIVLSLAQGRALRQAVYFGVAAGAAAVMTPGTELCRREDTERLYSQMISKQT
jgi:6-phosphofructokinase 2